MKNLLLRNPTIDNSYWYNGHLHSILISGKETNGKYSIIYGVETKGHEPPPHIHHNESESFFIIRGRMKFIIKNVVYNATKGTWITLPKGIMHQFKIQSPKVELLLRFEPAGFEDFFKSMSVPAKELDVPPTGLGKLTRFQIISSATNYGIEFPPLE